MTNIIKKHIVENLHSFIQPTEEFTRIFEKINHFRKNELKKYLVYIDNLVDASINMNLKELKYTHLHFEGANEDIIDILSEYIAIKFFLIGEKGDVNDIPNVGIIEELEAIEKELPDPNQLPYYVLPEKCKSKEALQRFKDEANKKIEGMRAKQSFLQEVKNTCTFLPKTLINIQTKTSRISRQRFEYVPFVIDIEELPNELSYCVANVEKSRDKIDEIKLDEDSFLLDNIENIIIFDCDQKQVHRQFNFKELNGWNDTQSTNFKNLIIFSFNSGQFRFCKLKNRLDRINTRYNMPIKGLEYPTYTILPCETSTLVENKKENAVENIFFGEKNSLFWEDFVLNLNSYEGLYELRSIKMMNLYSLAFNRELKDTIVENIFCPDKPSTLISNRTWETIQEFPEGNIRELKEGLSSVIDRIIGNEWVEKIRSELSDDVLLILPAAVRENKELLKNIRLVLGLPQSTLVGSWYNIDFSIDKDILILDYRDLGPFPYSVQPGIIDNIFTRSKSVKGVFLNLFFGNKYEWMNYNLYRDLSKLLQNSTRNTYFRWEDLLEKIQLLKPEKTDINWDLDDSYGNNTRVPIKVKYVGLDRNISCDAAELFIVKQGKGENFNVMRLDEIAEFDLDSDNVEIQRLDEIYSELNLYEKMANVEGEKAELNIIRNKFGLNEEEPGKLWKILLKSKVDTNGAEFIYNEFKSLLLRKNIRIVSFHHFKKNWINPESSGLIPREKKLFFELCKYLGLSMTYFRIMLRMRNMEMQSTKSSSKQMDRLLADVINDGCFDEDADVVSILKEKKQEYVLKHDFDEIGVPGDKVVEELIALVNLLAPKVKLNELESIENVRS